MARLYATLKSESSQLRSTENSCLFAVKQQKAHLKMDMYNDDMARAQNMTKKLTSHGEDTTGITKVINNATAQIQAFQLTVQNAQNSNQLQAALESFCLCNGCKNPATFTLQQLLQFK